MIVYRPNEGLDGLLLSAYQNIAQAGDLDRLLHKNAQSLTAFLSLLVAPTVTFLEASEELGVWFLAWAVSSFDGAVLSQWVHPKMRCRKAFVRASLRVRKMILTRVPTIVGLTKQPALVAEHERIGYTVAGTIPQFWDGEDVIVLVLTQERFQPVLQRYRRLLDDEGVAEGADYGRE